MRESYMCSFNNRGPVRAAEWEDACLNSRAVHRSSQDIGDAPNISGSVGCTHVHFLFGYLALQTIEE